ncbi:MAG: sulfatase [Puniceicoccales bacterium]|jgi:arylsulfatase A-like enzyme|nr:sulfatase [Puniceicoccales bacterium]
MKNSLARILQLLSVSAFVSCPVLAKEKPNIVFVLIDDLGWQDTSLPMGDAPTIFNKTYRTPAVEEMARTGVTFTDARACPVCSPTRVSLLSGMNAARHRVTSWTLRKEGETGFPSELPAPRDWRRAGFDVNWPSLPGLLKKNGYKTIMIGKAHFGAIDTPSADPLNLGFDVNIAGHASGGPASYQGEDNYASKSGGGVWNVPGLEKYHGTSTNLTDALTKEACAQIEAAAREQKPFFLYLAHYAVHVPIQPDKRFIKNYTGTKYAGTDFVMKPVETQYASMIEGYDASIRSVLDTLKKTGVARKTLVVFYSDNGGLAAHARGKTPYGGANSQNWPLRAGKGSAYEGGTRVPMVVVWAEVDAEASLQKDIPVKMGLRTKSAVMPEDFMPTFLHWAGGSLPADAKGVVHDGNDFTGALTGASSPGRPLVFHYPHSWIKPEPDYTPHSSIVLDGWKAIYFYIPDKWELYHIAGDIGEKTELSKDKPEKLRELATRLQKELSAREAQWPWNPKLKQEAPLKVPEGKAEG